MKATLEFTLPEEEGQFVTAINAQNMKFIIDHMDNWLRNKIKYESDNMTTQEYTAYEKTRDRLKELISENRID
jgi:hypothetical protein